MSDPNTNPAPTSSTSSTPPPPPPASSPSGSDAESRKAEALAAFERDEAAKASAGTSSSPSPTDSSSSSPTNAPPPLEDRAGFLTEEPPAKAAGLERSPAVAGADEVQSRVDAENAQGFIGSKVDPIPDEAYTLATGPESPSSIPDDRTRMPQHALDTRVTPPASSSSSSS